MNKRTLLFGLAVLLASGCGATLRVRVEAPVGAVLTVRDRADFFGLQEPEDQVALPIPFIAEFQSEGDSFAYPVTLVLPPEVAALYGGRGEARLSGELFVYSPTRAVGRGGMVSLSVPEAHIRSLLRGEVASTEAFVEDPNERSDWSPGQRHLVRLVLRATLR